MNPVHDQAFRDGQLVMDTKQELVDEIGRLRHVIDRAYRELFGWQSGATHYSFEAAMKLLDSETSN